MLFSVKNPEEYSIPEKITLIQNRLEFVKQRYSKTDKNNKFIDAYLHTAEYIINLLCKHIESGFFDDQIGE